MIALEETIGIVVLVSLTLYVLGAGADFGGGLWDLLASGPRAKDQRKLIAKALGPIWEANHVWLILVVVLLFVAFPKAFSAISIVLHIPLTVMLMGIVLRGSAFVFRTYDSQRDEVQKRWGTLFAVASIVTPIMLGISAGAVASGKFRFNEKGEVQTNFVSEWLAPFPIALGIYALLLFGFLSAVYLTMETSSNDLRNDFRKRAIISGTVCGAWAFACLLIAKWDASAFLNSFLKQGWSIPFQSVTAAVGISSLVALLKNRFRWARFFTIVLVTLVIFGWGLAQFPYLIYPSITFSAVAAPQRVLELLALALAGGAVLLFPSLWWLFKIFKR